MAVASALGVADADPPEPAGEDVPRCPALFIHAVTTACGLLWPAARFSAAVENRYPAAVIRSNGDWPSGLLWAKNLRRAMSSLCACATLVSVLETVSAEQRTAVRWSLVSLTTWVANVPWPTVDVVEVDVVVLVIGRVLLRVVVVVGRDDRLLICIVLRLLLIALPRATVVTLRHREHNTLETLVAL